MKLFRIQATVFQLLTAAGLSFCADQALSATPVTTLTATELQIPMQHQAPATALSLNESRIAAEITARIESIPVSVGDQVAQGEALIILNCESFELETRRIDAGIKASEAQIRLSQQQLRRALKLVKQKSASQELADQRRAEVDSRNAELVGQKVMRAEAQLKVNRCEIKAPYDALILERLAGEGEIAQSGTPLLAILDVNHIDVSARVRQTDAATLLQARKIWFETSGVRYPVRLRVLSPSIDPMARSREARLDFSSDKALPGASGRLIWNVDGHYLPAHFLLSREGQIGVFSAANDKARFIPVPGALEGRPVRFDDAIKATSAESGDAALQIIVKGRQGLVDGQAIRVVNDTPVDGE